MPVGQPLKFKSNQELQSKIDDYFNSCFVDSIDEDTGEKIKKCVRPLTITGLALALDTNRHTLLEYEEKDEYTHTIKRAKLRIESFAEEQLFTNPRTAGVIFNMVNNWAWQNKQENKSEISGYGGGPIEHKIEVVLSDDD